MSRLITTAVCGAFLLAFVASAMPAPAQAVTPSVWGWVTVRKPTTASYTPAAKDQGNSMGGTNTVVRQGPGQYRITFGGLDANTSCPPTNQNGCNGNLLATALSTTARNCVATELSSGLPVTAYIYCYDIAGHLADSRFSLNFLAPRDEHGTLAYVYADLMGTGVYYPLYDYNYNSVAANTNQKERLGTGYYRVHLYAMYAGSQGNLQLTSTGYPCKIESHSDQASPVPGVNVYVQCVNFIGDPADATFFLDYADGVGFTAVPGRTAAYLFANNPTAASYHPAASFRYSSVNKSATVRRTGKGVYAVTLAGMPFGGSAQVSAVGANRIQCQLGSIRGKGTPQVVGVRCLDGGGNPADSQFYLSYTH